MAKSCINCKKEIILQKVKNNFNLCYLCNFDLSDMEELKKLKVESKTKEPQVKCYKCGSEYKENPKDKDIHPKQCPNCIQSKVEDISDEYDLIQNGKVFNNVKVLDMDMEFGTMVMFMVKWVIASIPAMIILIFIFLIFNIILTGLGMSIGAMFR